MIRGFLCRCSFVFISYEAKVRKVWVSKNRPLPSFVLQKNSSRSRGVQLGLRYCWGGGNMAAPRIFPLGPSPQFLLPVFGSTLPSLYNFTTISNAVFFWEKLKFVLQIASYLGHLLVIALVEGIVPLAVNFKGQLGLIDAIRRETNLQHAILNFDTALKRIVMYWYKKNIFVRTDFFGLFLRKNQFSVLCYRE